MITPAAALHTSPADRQTPPWKSLPAPPATTWIVAVPLQVIRTTPGSVPVRPPVHAASPPAFALGAALAPDGAAAGARCPQPARSRGTATSATDRFTAAMYPRPRAAARPAARVTDAGQAGTDHPGQRLLRAEVGRVPVDRLPRRRRGRDRQPQRPADDPLLPGDRRGRPARAAAALRGRRRDRPGDRARAGLRGAAAAPASGRVPGRAARRPYPGLFHRLRPARARRR